MSKFWSCSSLIFVIFHGQNTRLSMVFNTFSQVESKSFPWKSVPPKKETMSKFWSCSSLARFAFFWHFSVENRAWYWRKSTNNHEKSLISIEFSLVFMILRRKSCVLLVKNHEKSWKNAYFFCRRRSEGEQLLEVRKCTNGRRLTICLAWI